jgi:glucosamine--fructose-6-phosphate aminotransferase (isomerizing)
MAGKEPEVSTPLLANILNQPTALREVSAHQFGEGHAALIQAAAFLKSRKKLVLSGMGASLFAAMPVQRSLAASGFDVVCKETAELLYFEASTITEDTAVILISRSGESIEVTKLLQQFHSVGVPVLGIVNVPGTSLALGANHCIELHSPSDQIVAIQTFIATSAVLALLHAAVVGELDKAKEELAQPADLLATLIPNWVENRNSWHAFLEADSPLYILGRGTSMGAVLEGQLLMHETAKFPSVAMSVPQFRHGPVEVVDSAFRAVVLATQPETQDLDAALVHDIIAMGGQSHLLGPYAVPRRFLPIVETIPLQILAYTKAELRGVTPGDFRWATAITTSEAGFCAQK